MEPVIRNYRGLYQPGGGPVRLISVDDNPASALSQLVRGANGQMVAAVPGHSYLLRVVAPGEHDHLVAFTLMEKSPESIVVVGRGSSCAIASARRC